MPSMPTRFQVKSALRYPVVARRRREFADSPIQRAVMEEFLYSDAIYGFSRRHHNDPELLTAFECVSGDVVVDVGAYDGDWAKRVSEKYPAAVHCFELSPVILSELKSRTSSIDAIQVHGFGLGGKNGEIPISRSLMGSSAYSHKNDEHEWDLGQIRDVNEVWGELEFDRVAAMKINIEGGEYELLNRMIASGLIEMVDTLLVQFHEWFPGAHRQRKRIRRALAQSHKQEWNYPFVWEKWVRQPVPPA